MWGAGVSGWGGGGRGGGKKVIRTQSEVSVYQQ